MELEKFFNLKEPQITLLRNLLIFVLAGAMLILIGNIFIESPKTGSTVQDMSGSPAKTYSRPLSAQEYKRQLQDELALFLSRVDGAGRVAVEVSLDGGYKYSFAVNNTIEENTTQEKDASGSRMVASKRGTEQVVTVRGSTGEEPLLVEVREPEIKGVMVLAEGAGNSQVKAKLAQAVRTFLGIPAYRVTVLEGKID